MNNSTTQTTPVELSLLIEIGDHAENLRQLLQRLRADSVTACEILLIMNSEAAEIARIVAIGLNGGFPLRCLPFAGAAGRGEKIARALEAAQGETICILSDGDLPHPGAFEQKLAILSAHPHIGFVYSSYALLEEPHEEDRSQPPPQYPIPNTLYPTPYALHPGLLPYSYLGGRHEFADLLSECYIATPTALFRRELWEHFGGIDGSVPGAEDWDMWLRFASHAQTAYIDAPLVSVRQPVRAASGEEAAEAHLRLWRKWLVKSDEPSVLSEGAWERLLQSYACALRDWFDDDSARTETYLQRAQEIKQENHRRIGEGFERAARFGRFARSHANALLANRAKETTRPMTSTLASLGHAIATPITWTCPLLDCSGYADEARHFLAALDDAGFLLRARVFGTPQRVELTADLLRRFTTMSSRPIQNNCVHVTHTTAPESVRLAEARWNVGRTMFETDRLPEEWVAACNRMDRIWVPSEFNRRTFAEAGVDAGKIAVVPGTLDFARYERSVTPLRIDGMRGYNFLSVFDWTRRKGWDTLLRAYVTEFSPEEDVALLIKTGSYISRGYTLDYISEMARRFVVEDLGQDPDHMPDIVIQDFHLPPAQMPCLYRAADCFVLPSRGEGWGRPYMEAMATGLPTIGTNWSGNTAFMNAQNSLLLDYTLVPVPQAAWKETPILRGHQWAEPDAAHLRRLMRQVFEERKAAQALGEAAAADLRARFSYDRVAAIIGEELTELEMERAA